MTTHPPQHAIDDDSLAFVIAAPRSGTTWLKEALSAHPGVHCTERRLFGRHADIVRDRGAAEPRVRITLDKYVESLLLHADTGPSNNPQRRVLAALAQTLIDLEREATGKRVVVDKITPYPGTSRRVVQGVRDIFPNARIVLLVRDGRDVAVSGVMHWLTKSLDAAADTPHTRARRAALLDADPGAHLDRLFTDAEIDEWATIWREPIEAVDEIDDPQRVLRVRYEEMLADQPAALRAIFRFLGVTHDDGAVQRCVDASSFERMSGGRRRGDDAPGQHVRKGVAGDWANWFTREDAQRFHAAAGELLVRLGYERDASWRNTVPARLTPVLR